MADLSIRFLEGIVKNVMVKIKNYYIPADFLVLDMQEDDDTPIILGGPFLNTTNTILYMRSRQVHFHLPVGKVRCDFNSYTDDNSP